MVKYHWIYNPLPDAWEEAYRTTTFGMGPGQEPWTVKTAIGPFDVACCCCRTMTVAAHFERIVRKHVAFLAAGIPAEEV